MSIRIINYLDLTSLLQAEREGRFMEKLENQRTGFDAPYNLATESYCLALLEMDKTKKQRPVTRRCKTQSFLFKLLNIRNIKKSQRL